MKMLKVYIATNGNSCLEEGYIVLRHVTAFRRHIDDCNKTVVFTYNDCFIIQMKFEDFELAMFNQE